MKNKYLVISVLVFISLNLEAQHPFNLKWKKIKTDHFEIIFPEEISNDGQRLANTLEFLYLPVSSTLHNNPKKISVFLSNQSVISNGYVSTIPRMSLFYTTPMQDATVLGSSDWLQTLAIHEFRHVVQTDLSNRKFTKLGSIFYGSLGLTGLAYSEPLWYSEGDAVITETMYSELGRGRIPAFTMPIKAQLLAQKDFKYEKTYLGSYKNYSPNHYALGYLLELQMRNDFGNDISYRVINRMAKYSYLPYAFSLALKKETGQNIRQMHKSTFDKYKNVWQNEIANIQETNKIEILKQTKFWTNYSYPQLVGSSIFAIKNGLADAQMLIKIDSLGNETKIKAMEGEKISSNAGKIVWSDFSSNIRWTEKSYSNIYIYDTKQSKTKQLTFQTRYFSPALSPNGIYIACVEFTTKSKSNLVILNAITGKVFKIFSLPTSDFIRTPTWSENGGKILFLHTSTKGQALSVIDFASGKIKMLLNYNFKNISNPVFYNDNIIFNMPVNGNDMICALDTNSMKIYSIATSKFGTFNASISFQNIIYQIYTENGHKIAISKIEKEKWQEVIEKSDYNKTLIVNILKSEDTSKILSKTILPDSIYQIKKYSKLLNALNIHAWGIYPGENEYDLTLISNNKLNTISINAGIRYKLTNQSFSKYVETQFSALFPIFHIGATTENRSTSFYENTQKNTVNWKENTTIFGAYLPLNFSKASLIHGLTIGSNIQIINRIAMESIGNYNIREGYFSPVTGYAIYQIYLQKAKRDVAPRLGAYLKTVARKTFLTQTYEGWQNFILGKIYLPSPIKHHSILIEGALEIKQSDISLSNQFVYPRGFEMGNHEKFIKFSANYHFPLLHPDLNILQLAYIKRVRANLFYDYGLAGSIENFKQNTQILLQSTGVEIFFDFNLFNIKYDFNAGLRYSLRLNDKKGFFEFLMFEIPIN